MDGWKVWMAREGKAVASADLDLMMLRRALLQSLCVISVFFSVQEQQPRPCRNCQLESIKNNVRQESGNEEAKSFWIETKRLTLTWSIDRSILQIASSFRVFFFGFSAFRDRGKKKKEKKKKKFYGLIFLIDDTQISRRKNWNMASFLEISSRPMSGLEGYLSGYWLIVRRIGGGVEIEGVIDKMRRQREYQLANDDAGVRRVSQ